MNENAVAPIVTPDAADLARVVAAHIVEGAKQSIAQRGRFDIALAGGSTPKAVYALLAAPGMRAAVAWDRIRFFFGDERCVPPDDDQSNYKSANDTLLRPLGIADDAIFRMQGEVDPPEAARSYAEIMRRELRLENDMPVFDSLMLGMGPDGHTASLFPGSDPFADDAALVRAPFVEKFGTYRITLTPRVIRHARDVFVAAAGEEKAAALAAARRPDADPVTYPIAILAGAKGHVTWFVDRAAAGHAG